MRNTSFTEGIVSIMPGQRILRNCIKCKSCGDIIESENAHDFKFCSCKRVAVDGGHDYLRRCVTDSSNDYEELSIVEGDNGADFRRS